MCAKTAYGIQIVVWIRDDYEAVSTITKEWKRKWGKAAVCSPISNYRRITLKAMSPSSHVGEDI